MALRITAADGEWSPKYYPVIVGVFCSLYMMALALNAKFITVFGLNMPAGILPFPICAIITDVLTEVYGFNRTRMAVWTVLFCTALFSAFSYLALSMPYPDFWHGQEAFKTIFASTPRIALAGSLAWVAGELANSLIMSKLKIFQDAKAMPLRFVGSTVVGQSLDTLTFVTVAFSGVLAGHDMLTLMVSSIFFKVTYEVLALPLSIPLTHRLKKLEGVEHFDRQKLSLI